MKNIHILPTDKPSRLYYNSNDKQFQLCKIEKISTVLKRNQNIYITNSEEIKEENYCILGKEVLSYHQMHKRWGMPQGDKIILTTDQDLIEDGIQAIDDEFLEWFVKNPSCEFVDIKKGYKNPNSKSFLSEVYKIYVPTEKFKQEALNHFLFTSSVIVKDPQTNNFNKQETLEEAGEKLYPNRESFLHRFQNIERKAFTEGAKWQMERSYSEEDMEIVEISSIDANYIPHYQTKEGQFLATKFNVKQFKNK